MMVFSKGQKHLTDCEWTYWQHLSHGLHQVWRLYKIGTMGLIHSLIPGVWPGAAPLGIYHIYKDMRKLKHVKPLYAKDDELDQTRE